MLAKYWKKVCLIVLIIACLFNIITKLVNKASTKDELQTSAQYMQDQKNKENQ